MKIKNTLTYLVSIIAEKHLGNNYILFGQIDKGILFEAKKIVDPEMLIFNGKITYIVSDLIEAPYIKIGSGSAIKTKKIKATEKLIIDGPVQNYDKDGLEIYAPCIEIGNGINVTGDIIYEKPKTEILAEDVIICGKLIGNLTNIPYIEIKGNGKLEGNITYTDNVTKKLVIDGELKGNASAECIVIGNKGSLIGDAETFEGNFIIRDWGFFDGKCDLKKEFENKN